MAQPNHSARQPGKTQSGAIAQGEWGSPPLPPHPRFQIPTLSFPESVIISPLCSSVSHLPNGDDNCSHLVVCSQEGDHTCIIRQHTVSPQ